MRIIGGRLKGRVLRGPANLAIRPTSDRLRETIFNILAHAYDNVVEGADVLDLFAGTGAMGIEALSRGARHVLFVDRERESCALIAANVGALGLTASARILRRDACKLGKAGSAERFGLAFLDPPYGRGLVPPALTALRDGGFLAPGALIIIEESAGVELSMPENFITRDVRRSGETQILFVTFEPKI